MNDEREMIDGLMSDAEAALARGAISKAQALYHGILRLDPRHTGALRHLATIEINSGVPATALAFFEQARQIAPLDADLCHGIATALRLMGRSSDSELALKAALKIDRRHEPSLYDLAMTRQQRGDHPGAAAIYLALAAQGVGRFDAVFNRGVTLFRMGNLMAAERWFHVAALVDPTSALPFINLGMVYRTWGFVKQAVACQEQAVSLAPSSAEAHWNLANALLVSGDFQRGFTEYEWRFRRVGRAERPAGLALGIPRWSGERLNGKTLLVTLEQGLGDAVQFVRFTEQAAALGARVVLECLPPLAPLLATAPGVAAVVTPGEEVPEAVCYAPLMSLPHLLNITLDTLPARVPYLRVSPGKDVPRFDVPGLRVGLVWRGNPQHENDRRRSMFLDTLTPLLDVSDVSFFSLQVGEGASECAVAPWASRMIDLAPRLETFADTAAAVQALDLVITVDTAVAHVAGALGKPVWVLLALGNDWRWLHDRDDSPWYPSMRLFRQRRFKRWGAPVRAVKEALSDLIARTPPRG